ncbi:hypothetical protein KJ682_15080 [bacterium]|nr:hypothetical protein [bacterium]
MKKFLIPAALLAAILALALLSGCGGGDANAQACSACGMNVPDADAKTVDGKVYCSACAAKIQPAVDAVAVHDCDGGCGMTAVPEAQMTEVDGKWYCKGCLAKVEAEKAAEHPEHPGHDGHDH